MVEGEERSNASFRSPSGLWLTTSGDLYVTDTYQQRVRKVTTIVKTIAGTGVGGYDGEGLPANTSKLYSPFGIYVSTTGIVYIAENSNNLVRTVSLNGIISTFAGLGLNKLSSAGYGGDGGDATAAILNSPVDVKGDTLGNIYIAEQLLIKVVNPYGKIFTLFGSGNQGFSTLLAPASDPVQVRGIFIDTLGIIYFTEAGNNVVRKTIPNRYPAPTLNTQMYTKVIVATGLEFGFINTFSIHFLGICVNQTSLEIYLSTATALLKIGTNGSLETLDSASCGANYIFCNTGNGDIYYSCPVYHKVFKFSKGTITRLAGSVSGYSGDQGPAVDAVLDEPRGVWVSSTGYMFIADSLNRRVRKIDLTTGIISNYAGSGACCYLGDGGLALNATLQPSGLYGDSNGNLYIIDIVHYRIRVVNATGYISTFVGDGIQGRLKENSLASKANLYSPKDIKGDTVGSIYYSDNCSIKKVSMGIVTTIIGSSICSTRRNVAPATDPQTGAITFSLATNGDIYYVMGSYIRKSFTYTLSSEEQYSKLYLQLLAGQGIPKFYGEGTPAINAVVFNPLGIWVDSYENIYFADNTKRVRKIDVNGTIYTIAGNGTAGIDPSYIDFFFTSSFCS